MMMLGYVYMLRKIEIKINKLEGMIKELCIKKNVHILYVLGKNLFRNEQ